MTVSNSPIRDVKFVAEAPNMSSSIEAQQEQLHLSKKPRNYKYWSDEEVKRILDWLTLPENEGKLSRNKAQACREVAKKLFDGDEYMAISVRSKLMSLEKGYKEAEQLRQQLNSCTKDEAVINEKIKEVSKFHKECQLLFGGQKTTESFASNLTSPTTPSASISNSTSLVTHSYSPIDSRHSSISIHTNNDNHKHIPNNLILARPEYDHPAPYDATNPAQHHSLSINTLPHLNEDHLRPLTSTPSIARGQWTLPPVNSVDLPPVEPLNSQNIPKKITNKNIHTHIAPPEQQHQQHQEQQIQQQHKGKRRRSLQDSSTKDSNVLIAKYAAKQASYAAKQAQYEALKSEHERIKMEHAVHLAKIELDRDALSIKKLELELQLVKNKERS